MTEHKNEEQSAAAAAAHPAPRRILVAEDDEGTARLLAEILQDQGYAPHVIANGAQVGAEVRRSEPALVLLDLSLPGCDGIEICQSIRRFSAVPIIMVSARDEEIDRLLGLEVGADDYVCKPFSQRELLARVKAQLRRAEGRLQEGGSVHGFRVDDGAQRIAWQDAWLPLTPVEFRLLRRLLSRPGQVFTRTDLHESDEATPRVIDSHIKNLRRKIAAVRPEGSAIVSVYGTGYRFDPHAREAVAAA